MISVAPTSLEMRAALAREDAAATPGDFATRFSLGRRAKERVAKVLNTLAMLDRAELLATVTHH